MDLHKEEVFLTVVHHVRLAGAGAGAAAPPLTVVLLMVRGGVASPRVRAQDWRLAVWLALRTGGGWCWRCRSVIVLALPVGAGESGLCGVFRPAATVIPLPAVPAPPWYPLFPLEFFQQKFQQSDPDFEPEKSIPIHFCNGMCNRVKCTLKMALYPLFAYVLTDRLHNNSSHPFFFLPLSPLPISPAPLPVACSCLSLSTFC